MDERDKREAGIDLYHKTLKKEPEIELSRPFL